MPHREESLDRSVVGTRVERTLDDLMKSHGRFLAAVEAGSGIRAAIEAAYDWDLDVFDPEMAVAQIDQIVVRRLNDFISDSPRPRILDCGANIGISVLNFKRHAPDARIVAFEPDPLLCHTLRRNLTRNGAEDVEIVEAAVWTNAGDAPFVSNGTDGGRIAIGEEATATTSVRTVALADYLNEPIDLLKLDVEGSEYALIDHIATRLGVIKNLIIECHITQASLAAFGRLLTQLRDHGFHVNFNTFGHWRDLIRQPVLPPLYSEHYVAVYACRRVSPRAENVSSNLPYLELSLLATFYRAYESHGGPLAYQRLQKALGRRQRKVIRLEQPFHHKGGRCWTLELPPTVPEGDTPTQPQASQLLLFEDKAPIGPPHCEHALIARYGSGRFSHWHNTLYFSTSDDSNPNVNGRTYDVAIEVEGHTVNTAS